MTSLILNLVVAIWPFLKSVIFNDRPVLAVLKANKHFTATFFLLWVVCAILVVSTVELHEVKAALKIRNQELAILRDEFKTHTKDHTVITESDRQRIARKLRGGVD